MSGQNTHDLASDFAAPSAAIDALPGPAGLPLLGNVFDLFGAPLPSRLEAWALQYGSIFQFSRFGTRIVCISEPPVVRAILKARPDGFRRFRDLGRAIEATGFRGLFTAESPNWLRQRRLVMRGLTPEVVRATLPHINTVASRLATVWRASDAAVDVTLDLKRFSTDVVMHASLGVDLNCTERPDHPLQGAVDIWFKMIGRQMLTPRKLQAFIGFFTERKAADAVALLHTTAQTAIDNARADMLKPGAKAQNILQAMVQAQSQSDSDCTADDVLGNTGTMILAGQETTATAMSWLLYYLAKEPELFAEQRAAVDDVLGEHEFAPDLDTFNRLPQLQHLCQEVLRLRPVAPIMGMTANHDMNVAGLKLRAGQPVVVLLRSGDIPEQLANGPAPFEASLGAPRLASKPVSDHLAFGGGARQCPGRYLALVEMLALGVMVLRQFDLSLETTDVEEAYTFTLHAKTLRIRLTPRSPDRTH